MLVPAVEGPGEVGVGVGGHGPVRWPPLGAAPAAGLGGGPAAVGRPPAAGEPGGPEGGAGEASRLVGPPARPGRSRAPAGRRGTGPSARLQSRSPVVAIYPEPMKEFAVYTALRLVLFAGAFAIVAGIWLAVTDSVPVLW